MVEVTIPLVLDIIRTAGILVGIIYYITIMRNQQRTRELALESQELARKAQEEAIETRRTQILMQLYQDLNDEETNKSWAELVNLTVKDHDEFLEKYNSTVNPTHYAKRAHLWYLYNTIGELLRTEIIDIELLQRLMLSPQVIVMWEKWEEIIRETRTREKIPDAWAGFEYLYNEMIRYRESIELPAIEYPQK
jgi:hypothetical protein